MIEQIIRLYDGSAANAAASGEGFTVYVSRSGAVYIGTANGSGVLSPLTLYGYCDEAVPFTGGVAERRVLDVTIKN